MKHLLKLSLAALFAAAMLPAAHAISFEDEELDHIMPTLGWEDEEAVDHVMPTF